MSTATGQQPQDGPLAEVHQYDDTGRANQPKPFMRFTDFYLDSRSGAVLIPAYAVYDAVDAFEANRKRPPPPQT